MGDVATNSVTCCKPETREPDALCDTRVWTWYLFCEVEETQALTRADKKLKEGVKTENKDHINLKVAGQDGSVVQLKSKRQTPLSKLMKTYCERQDPSAQLEMEDEDTIDVFQRQTRGVF
ncbi:small ubiquitin-related modifier 2-A-like [Elephas maximus indicus]|uniref:small ubiquitin-related modifier 2-A-like n=1 Tax=Elephas maximus indicus TaxID=99487 RepID=UPI002116D223|nr:small ubiquitin-related modifier 2-A-like [Elephas maximus indicus]